MRVAFYAPLKPPDHPVPSGDRRMARLLIRALEESGHAVELASRFRSRDGAGDVARQARLAALGRRLADRLVRRYRNRPPAERPAAWLTYHLYHKAPDWLGPSVSAALDIPYLIAEASFAPKQAGGPWAEGHRAAADAIRRADRVVGLAAHDAPCIRPLLDAPRRLALLAPFIDTAPFAAAAAHRDHHRRAIAERFHLDPTVPWLLAVAMMRADVKRESYRVLAEALARLEGRAWALVVVGDGPARPTVAEDLRRAGGGRVSLLGTLDGDSLPALYAAADLYVWPALGEAYGMALIEAQAAGLPVVAGRTGGVPEVVRDGATGVLVAPGDAAAFADAVAALLDDPRGRAALGRSAARAAARTHDIAGAARVLDDILRAAVVERRP